MARAARRGKARFGAARQEWRGAVQHGLVWRVSVEARSGRTGKARTGKDWRGMAGMDWLGEAAMGMARQEWLLFVQR